MIRVLGVSHQLGINVIIHVLLSVAYCFTHTIQSRVFPLGTYSPVNQPSFNCHHQMESVNMERVVFRFSALAFLPFGCILVNLSLSEPKLLLH